jgi:hypothetical protein
MICGGHSGTAPVFFLSTFLFPVSIIPPMLHTLTRARAHTHTHTQDTHTETHRRTHTDTYTHTHTLSSRLLLTEGQMGEAWVLPSKVMPLRNLRINNKEAYFCCCLFQTTSVCITLEHIYRTSAMFAHKLSPSKQKPVVPEWQILPEFSPLRTSGSKTIRCV